MSSSDFLELAEARAKIAAAVREVAASRRAPLVVAFDGPSGSGKSTLASRVASDLGGTLVPGDDFYAAEIPDGKWASLAPDGRADLAIDWRRLRAEALEPLIAGQPARWHAFDFAAGPRPDGIYPLESAWSEGSPAKIIVLDGAYSTRPELSDLIAVAVLVVAEPEVRRARVAAREEASFVTSWHERWDAAEDFYFSQVRPPASFDLVVSV